MKTRCAAGQGAFSFYRASEALLLLKRIW